MKANNIDSYLNVHIALKGAYLTKKQIQKNFKYKNKQQQQQQHKHATIITNYYERLQSEEAKKENENWLQFFNNIYDVAVLLVQLLQFQNACQISFLSN